jgi:DNA mismatch repair protein mutS
MEINLKEYYADRAQSLAKEIAGLKQKSRSFVAGQIIFFLAFIVFVVFYTTTAGGRLLLVMAALSVIAYFIVRRFDVLNSEKIATQNSLLQVYQHEMAYQEGDYSAFYDGREYVDPQHPFTFDLDIFGSQSLFQRINRTVTTGGSRRLASLLSTEHESAQGEIERITLQKEAIDELAEMETWRADFLAIGQKAGEKLDSSAIREAHERISSVRLPSFMGSLPVIIVAYAAIAGLWASVVLPFLTPLSGEVAVTWGVLQFIAVFLLCMKPLRVIRKSVDVLHKHLQAYISLIRHLSATQFKAEDNRRVVRQLQTASISFERLEDILNGLDRRGNILGLLIMNTFLLSDVFLVRRFCQWQRLYMSHVMDWVDEVSHIDALVSMATFRYNEPFGTSAQLVVDENLVYEARGLYHPFLGKKAVRNDFMIEEGHYYIITGANMAGKSTFLRSVGINYVLAMNGMPVFADALKVSVYRLFSSMRTTDDLSHGISYFNAELLRLKQLINFCRHSKHTLIILDEILKGTNSLDKLNGSRLFLNAISSLPVSGMIATHDLELSKMSELHPERFSNYCFEIELAENINYTYKITPGVARNQNATFLLKGILA